METNDFERLMDAWKESGMWRAEAESAAKAIDAYLRDPNDHNEQKLRNSLKSIKDLL